MSTGPDESLLLAGVEQVFRVAYRLTGHRADAEDLVQDVCEAALRKAPDLATAQDCRRWLLRVLYNRFVDRKRHDRRSPLVAEDADGAADAALSADAPDPEELAAQADAERALARAWARLEPSQQMLLMLRAEGHELDEIARIADLEKHALSSRLEPSEVPGRRTVGAALTRRQGETTMNCDDITRLLDERARSELSAVEAGDIEAHAAQCPECARQWLASERLTRFRSDVPALPPALREQARRLQAACEAPPVRKSTRRPLLFGSLFVLGAAATTVAAFSWQDASAANR